MEIRITDRVIIIQGASEWMKDNDFWLEGMGENIDGMGGEVLDDYTHLKGNSSHFIINLGFDYHIGVHPMWLKLV